MLPRQRGEPHDRQDDWHSWQCPEVDHVQDVTAMMIADTILQILHGQAHAYGLAPYAALWRNPLTERARRRRDRAARKLPSRPRGGQAGVRRGPRLPTRPT